jgi:two-component system, cell cycle response regulator DivK
MDKKYLWKEKTILVVEDEDYVRRFLERLLMPTEAKLLFAPNGIVAVDICKSDTKIDVILMDMKLPELNGFEAVKRIKAHNKNLQIIAQTAYAMSGDRDKCIDAGCDDYISKPINPTFLLEKIESAFGKVKE